MGLLPFYPPPQGLAFVIGVINPDGMLEGRILERLGEGQHARMLLTDFFPELDSFNGCVSVPVALDFVLVPLRPEGLIWSSVLTARASGSAGSRATRLKAPE